MKRQYWTDALRSVPVSLLAMIVTAVVVALAMAIHRRNLPESDELLLVLVIGSLGMAVNSAIVLALVYVPAVATLRGMTGRAARNWVRFSGLVLWPIAFAAFLESARLITPNNPRLRPSVWDDLEYILRHPEVTAPVLFALLAGGMIFGIRQAAKVDRAR